MLTKAEIEAIQGRVHNTYPGHSNYTGPFYEARDDVKALLADRAELVALLPDPREAAGWKDQRYAHETVMLSKRVSPAKLSIAHGIPERDWPAWIRAAKEME